MPYIDLRSDTVTQPTPQMREAMACAPVGDDVYFDDPTINELEALAARMLGKEAALFVTSGTQGNAVAFLSHTRRGEAIIVGRGSHIADHEAGSYGMLAGVSLCFPEEDEGILRPQSVAALIRDDSEIQQATTGLICLENALSNGNVVPVDNMAEIYRIAQAQGIPVHLDGARLFNAAAYLGVNVQDMTQHCDSVMCCLSKGLCAPVGSMVAGSAAFIHKARRMRKVLGGGMRQAGILAAAGILALTDMTGRIADDHATARYLAEKLAQLPGVHVQENLLKINMVFFTVDWPESVCALFSSYMLAQHIKVFPHMDGMYRMVTNNDVSQADCDTVVAAMERFLQEQL